MAEQTDDGFLLYLIDIAIIEANAKSRSSKNGLESLAPLSLERNAQESPQKPVPKLQFIH